MDRLASGFGCSLREQRLQFAVRFAFALLGLGTALNHVGQPRIVFLDCGLGIINFLRKGLYLRRDAQNHRACLHDLPFARLLLLLLLALGERLNRFKPHALDVMQGHPPVAPLVDVLVDHGHGFCDGEKLQRFHDFAATAFERWLGQTFDRADVFDEHAQKALG